MPDNRAEKWTPNQYPLLFKRRRLAGLQGKLIIPYVLLTLLIASLGTYIVTRLVTASIRERFVNQLYESSRVASDGIVRQERNHLEYLRLMAYTQGVADAFDNRDGAVLQELLLPVAMNSKVQLVTAVDMTGQEIISLSRNLTDGQYILSNGSDFSAIPLVQKIMAGKVDEQGDKYIQILETHFGPALVTSAPVRRTDGETSGILLVGTYLESLSKEIKAQALGDIIILDQGYTLINTSLAQVQEYAQGIETAARAAQDGHLSSIQTIQLYNRSFQIVFTPLVARQQPLGWLGVVYPSNYIVSAEATSRNTFSILFSLGTVAVILIGYILSQNIARPILQLRSLSQSVAAGDLNQVINLQRSDEIGDLAFAYDQMTVRLRERTEEASRLYDETLQRNKELQETNQQLRAAQLQLVQSEKLAAIGQLTAGIVHDVKTPLGVIKGMAELIQEGDGLGPQTKMDLNLIRENAERANKIVTDLLKFARQSKPEIRRQDLRETVETTLRLTSYMIRKNQITLELELPHQPVMACYDSQQIEQVLINLIHNAIQAMPKSGTLQVRLCLTGENASISVRDTGIGIAAEDINRIFDPFFTTKPVGEGTGLGLSVSYGIVACHSGRIEVESGPGQGSTFTVILPLEPPLGRDGEE